MKTAASILLIVLSVPLFLIGIFAVVFRFELLNPGFWQSAFGKNNTYSTLAAVLTKSLEDQAVKQGGVGTDVKVLTDLITPLNVEDFVDKNIANILNFADAKTGTFFIYIPINKIPKGLLPPAFASLPQEIEAASLLSRFNVQGINQSQLQNLSQVGHFSTLLLILDVSLFILFTILLFVLVSPGTRFTIPGIAFILEGLFALLVYQGVSQVAAGAAHDLVLRSTTAEVLLGTLLPPVLFEALKIWLVVGVIFVICGIVLLFLKKGK